MNKKEIIEKIELYEADLAFCKGSGYQIVAADLEDKIKMLNELLKQQKV